MATTARVHSPCPRSKSMKKSKRRAAMLTAEKYAALRIGFANQIIYRGMDVLSESELGQVTAGLCQPQAAEWYREQLDIIVVGYGRKDLDVSRRAFCQKCESQTAPKLCHLKRHLRWARFQMDDPAPLSMRDW